MSDMKELVLSSIISAMLSVAVTYTVSLLSDVFNIFDAVLLFVLTMLVFRLIRYRKIFTKISFGQKEYYDIMADIVYFTNRHSRNNNIVIEKLDWNFICTYNNRSNQFLDIKEKWTIDFTSAFGNPNQLHLGIKGGENETLSLTGMQAYQNSNRLDTPSKDLVGTGCRFNLPVSIKRNENCRFSLEFDWPRFSVLDHDDDYFFLLPKSQARKIKNFTMKIEHPYACTAQILIFKQGVFGYHRDIIDNNNCIKYKAIIHNEPREFSMSIQDLGAMDVLLIVFNTVKQTGSEKSEQQRQM